MTLRFFGQALGLLALVAGAAGCASPYHADRGALFGGLAGAGVGALVGEAVGNPLAGAAIGAGVGTLSGAAIGSSLDDIEARNRAMIEARLGRPVVAGAVTPPEVIAMAQAGVDDELIVNHIRAHGVAQIPQAGDLITLKSNGVSPRVIAAMQSPPIAHSTPVIHEPSPPPVIIEHHYEPWPPPPPPWRRRFGPPPPF